MREWTYLILVSVSLGCYVYAVLGYMWNRNNYGYVYLLAVSIVASCLGLWLLG